MTDLFRMIETPAAVEGLSEMAELFMRRQAGLITHEEYILGNCHGIAADLAQWKPRPYLPPMPDVEVYVDQRLHGHREYDQTIGMKLGNWLAGNLRILDHNMKNLETLHWAHEVLRKNKLNSEADRIQFFVTTYDKVAFPEHQYQEGRKAQVKDSHAAQSKLRDRS
jgi:hypothetical protein